MKQLLGLPSDPPERNRTHCNSRIGSWSVPNQGWRITKEAQEWPLGTYTCPGLFNLHLYSLNESACASQCLKYQNVMVSLSTEQIFHVIKPLSLWIPTAGNAEERDVDLHGCKTLFLNRRQFQKFQCWNSLELSSANAHYHMHKQELLCHTTSLTPTKAHSWDCKVFSLKRKPLTKSTYFMSGSALFSVKS